MRSEDRLILLLCRDNLDESEVFPMKNLLKTRINWNLILEKALEEGVFCLLYHRLNKPEFKDYIPRDILERWKEIYCINLARNMLINQETKNFFGILKEKNIKAAVLKGTFLAEIIYKNFSLRPISDIDILIQKEDLPRVNEILNSLGYKSAVDYRIYLDDYLSSINALAYSRDSRDSISCGPMDFFVHLHWHIINSTWPLDFLVSKIDMKRLWSAAESAKIDGVDILTLAPHHLLIYLAYHSFQHGFNRLILSCDIFESLRYYKDRLNWDLVAGEAERFSLSGILYFSLYSTSKLLGVKIPELERLRLDKSGFPEKLSSFFISRGMRLPGIYYLACLLGQKGILPKLKFVKKTFLPSSYVMAHNFNLAPSEINASHYSQRIFNYLSNFLP